MATPHPLPSSIGIYLVERLIGKGGMGVVYLATDPTLHRPVAVKLLPPELAADPECVARFKREATSLAQIRHPNLVHIYAVGVDAARHYIAMEFIEGITVADLIGRQGTLPHAAAIRILGQVLSALAKVHAAGIIHRDLKPANIMIDENRSAILMDFGLAKPRYDHSVTTSNSLIGTPEYMAPELAEGHDATFRSDIYSAGVVLFEMLTGRVPFQGKSAIATLRQHLERPTPSARELTPSLPSSLDPILTRALAKDPAERYSHVAAFAADLLAVTPTPELAALAAPPGPPPGTVGTLPLQAAATPAQHGGEPAHEAPTTATALPVSAAPLRRPASPRRRFITAGAALAIVLIALAAVLGPRWLRPAPKASQTRYVVVVRGKGPTHGRLLTIEGEEGDVVIQTDTGTVRIPYRNVLRIEPADGR